MPELPDVGVHLEGLERRIGRERLEASSRVWGAMVSKRCSTSHGQPFSGSRRRAMTWRRRRTSFMDGGSML